METPIRKLAVALLMAMMLVGVAACDSQGPAEEAGEDIGESIDDAAESAGEGMEEIGENIQSAAKDAQN